MKVLILGASGFIGSSLAQVLAGHHTVLGTYRWHKPVIPAVALAPLDLADDRAVKTLARDFRPAIIIHLVAQAVVEEVALQHESAWQINVAGTEGVVVACHEVGAQMLFLSTDYVFDGAAGPYAEDAACNPLTAYGRAKLAGEEIIWQSRIPYLIIRTSLVYGWPAPHHHPTFAAAVIHRLRQGHPCTAYTDMIRTPLYVGDLGNMLVELIERGVEGLYHVGSIDIVSMYEFALHICKVFKLDRGLIRAAPSETAEGVSRPRRCGLRTEKATRDFALRLPTTLEGLYRMKEEEIV